MNKKLYYNARRAAGLRRFPRLRMKKAARWGRPVLEVVGRLLFVNHAALVEVNLRLAFAEAAVAVAAAVQPVEVSVVLR